MGEIREPQTQSVMNIVSPILGDRWYGSHLTRSQWTLTGFIHMECLEGRFQSKLVATKKSINMKRTVFLAALNSLPTVGSWDSKGNLKETCWFYVESETSRYPLTCPHLSSNPPSLTPSPTTRLKGELFPSPLLTIWDEQWSLSEPQVTLLTKY